jgi:hypothetical protein
MFGLFTRVPSLISSIMLIDRALRKSSSIKALLA